MKTTQCQRIIDYMHQFGSISTLFKVYRLAEEEK